MLSRDESRQLNQYLAFVKKSIAADCILYVRMPVKILIFKRVYLENGFQ